MGHFDQAGRIERLKANFRTTLGGEADFVARAPGRINLIGEHTDYNGGFVLPAAIDRTVLIAVRATPGSRQVKIVSQNYGNSATFNLDSISPTGDKDQSWSNYVRGVAWALGEQELVDLQAMPGAQMAIEGNVPLSAGLSSSAAIEVASALALTRLAGVTLEGTTLALACQRAENDFIGVKSGIMDQFISALGQADAALLIDTRSLDYRSIPLGLEELGYKLVAVNSAVPRKLGSTAYNRRRAECEEAVRILAPLLGLGENAQLRDVSLEQFVAHADALPETLRKRARHVISEDARTLEAVALMESGLGEENNLARFGQLLYASHASLRYDYEVSSAELDLLVALARDTPGVAGARMTGAGFGGCTVNIVEASHLPDFERQVVEEYRRRTALDAQIYVCKAVQGGTYL
ncbi:MAG: galactokinase [Chloroflexi bacterium]|nr:galactokinase [Chloroflexota bacterium]